MPVMIGGIVGILLAVGGVGFLVYHKRQGTTTTTATATPSVLPGAAIQVAINTNPPGASILGLTGKRNALRIAPSRWLREVIRSPRFWTGYEPAASAVTLTAGAAAPPLNLNLVRRCRARVCSTDLPVGKITWTIRSASDLVDGQFDGKSKARNARREARFTPGRSAIHGRLIAGWQARKSL